MDIQYLGGILVAIQAIQSDRSRITTKAAIDAYYERHARADRFIPRAAFLVATIGLVLVTAGLQ
jgi:hypothetical protein